MCRRSLHNNTQLCVFSVPPWSVKVLSSTRTFIFGTTSLSGGGLCHHGDAMQISLSCSHYDKWTGNDRPHGLTPILWYAIIFNGVLHDSVLVSHRPGHRPQSSSLCCCWTCGGPLSPQLLCCFSRVCWLFALTLVSIPWSFSSSGATARRPPHHHGREKHQDRHCQPGQMQTQEMSPGV